MNEAVERVAKVLGLEAFSDDPGERAVEFMSHLPAFHGAAAKKGEPIGLMGWQEDAVRRMYGALREDGTRQYRTAYIEIPRKNGKSTFTSMLILHSLMLEREPAGEIYSVAYTANQARIVFDAAVNMLRKFPEEFVAIDSKPKKGQAIRVSNYYGTIENLEMRTKYEVLAATKAGNYGYNPHLIVFDELHVQKSRELWDVMRTAQGARDEPLNVAITTAGDSRDSICWEMHEYALRVRDGEIEDESFLPLLFSADKDDDWKSPETWRKANPSLGHTLNERWLAKECEYAQRVPAAQNTFKREHLNLWTEQTTRWLDVDVWNECADGSSRKEYEAALVGKKCYAGLDLASTVDLTAQVQVFPSPEGLYWVLARFWMPEEKVLERTQQHGFPFDLWAKDGWIETTPGNVVDYDYIRKQMNEWGDQYAYQQVGFDPWNATQLSLQLDGDGFTMVPMRQGFQTMSEPSKQLEALIVGKKIRHNNNPVLDWCISNVEVLQDSNGNKRPVKPKDEWRNVDGVVALVMAIGRAMVDRDDGESVYAKSGMMVL